MENYLFLGKICFLVRCDLLYTAFWPHQTIELQHCVYCSVVLVICPQKLFDHVVSDNGSCTSVGFFALIFMSLIGSFESSWLLLILGTVECVDDVI